MVVIEGMKLPWIEPARIMLHPIGQHGHDRQALSRSTATGAQVHLYYVNKSKRDGSNTKYDLYYSYILTTTERTRKNEGRISSLPARR